MTADAKLKWWCLGLFVLTLIAAGQSILAPVMMLFQGAPIILLHEGQVWNTKLVTLPAVDAIFCAVIVLAPQVLWIYALMIVAGLARGYRRGQYFGRMVLDSFHRLGVALLIMGGLSSLVLPAISIWFAWRDITPWLADIPFFAVVDFDLLVAGAFFIIIGRIMMYGSMLEENDRLTI